jgi:MFS family permease
MLAINVDFLLAQPRATEHGAGTRHHHDEPAVGDQRAAHRLVGTVLFGLASLACGLAGSSEFLIAMRVAQGVSSGILMPLTAAVVASAYADEHARGRAIGLVYGVGAVGAGGLLLAVRRRALPAASVSAPSS